jgi:hypothetical protein
MPTRGGELPAYGLIPDGIANYISQKVSWAKMNQADREAAAIKLMSEAGYGPRKPLNVRLTYATLSLSSRLATASRLLPPRSGLSRSDTTCLPAHADRASARGRRVPRQGQPEEPGNPRQG